MIVEVRSYRIKPGRRAEFVQLFETRAVPAQRKLGIDHRPDARSRRTRTSSSSCEVFLPEKFSSEYAHDRFWAAPWPLLRPTHLRNTAFDSPRLSVMAFELRTTAPSCSRMPNSRTSALRSPSFIDACRRT
jgi:hypothetical protein